MKSIDQQQALCFELRSKSVVKSLSQTILPTDILILISHYVFDDCERSLLQRSHNICYFFRNPIVRIFEEMDIF